MLVKTISKMKSVILLISIIVLFSNVDKSYQQLNACSYVSQFDSTGTALGAASIVASINECCLLCQVNAQCQSWTFACAPNSNQGYCFLKSSVGQLYPCGGSKINLILIFQQLNLLIYIEDLRESKIFHLQLLPQLQQH